jgi:hypothetical protein
MAIGIKNALKHTADLSAIDVILLKKAAATVNAMAATCNRLKQSAMANVMEDVICKQLMVPGVGHPVTDNGATITKRKLLMLPDADHPATDSGMMTNKRILLMLLGVDHPATDSGVTKNKRKLLMLLGVDHPVMDNGVTTKLNRLLLKPNNKPNVMESAMAAVI